MAEGLLRFSLRPAQDWVSTLLLHVMFQLQTGNGEELREAGAPGPVTILWLSSFKQIWGTLLLFLPNFL